MVDVEIVVINMDRVKIKTQDRKERINNFDEVSFTLNKEDAIKEANRCLNCKNPNCVKGCPVNIRIPEFIQAIKNDDLNLASDIIRESNNLPEICGRVCPQESQCEKLCIQGLKGESIAIGALERYVADNVKSDIKVSTKNDTKVAIIGSGPSGISCAYDLIKNGYNVTIYESLHECGGVLRYGIPSFRLPKNLVDEKISELKKLGVNFITDALVGKNILISELIEEYDYIYIATGAGLPRFMGIKNESANRVFSANEILTRVNLMSNKTPIYVGKNVSVIGGGNVAMDVARTLKRLGSDVTVYYRRSEELLPARKEEYIHACEEDINFKFLCVPIEVIIDNDNNVTGMYIVDTKIVDGRVQEVPDTKKTISTDMIVMALGTNPAKIINTEKILDVNKDLIKVNDYQTNIDKIYAGGDAISGSATVIKAMEAGKSVAKKIMERN